MQDITLTLSPLALQISAVVLCLVLLSSLTRDLGRAFRWFMRTLMRVGITVAIVAFIWASFFLK